MNRLALVASIALLALGALWLVVRESGGGRGARPAQPEVAGEDATESGPEELARAASPGPVARETSTPREAPETFPVEYQSFELAGARWLDVTVAIPIGLPPDDEPALIGITSPGEFDDADLDSPDVIAEFSNRLGPGDPFARELEDDDDWSRRPLTPHVRLPFPPEARTAVVVIQSRYLVPDPLKVDLPTTPALTLEPELGGYVTGRCRFPAEPPAASEISIEFDGRARSDGIMGFARPDSRDAGVRDDLGFELRALSPKRKYAVQAHAKGYVGHFELSFEIAPGEHRELELAFRVGASVSGRVLGDGQPVSGADVTAEVKGALPWNDGKEVESGADGSFLIEGLPTGTVTLHADKGGWLAAKGEPLAVVEGQTTSGIELVLDAGQRVRGRVVWPGGAPVAGARVKALKPHEHWLQELVEVKCEEDGTFLLGGLETDSVEVFAEHGPDESREEKTRGEKISVAQESSETSPDTSVRYGRWIAVATAVTPGTNDLVLTLQPPHRVTGRVADDTGQPVKSFRVIARRTDRPDNAPEEVEHNFDAEDARFELDVGLSGEWAFQASDPAGEPESEKVVLPLPQGGAELVLVLPRASSVSGQVVDPGARPVAGAKVHVTDDPRAAAFAFFGDGEGETDAEGGFTLSSVKNGSYVHASHEDWASSERVALELTPGETRTGLVLALRHGARITGEVFDEEGKPDPGQNVNCASGALAAMAFGFGGEASCVTDAAGRFVFEHVTPGKVTVSAVPSEEELFSKLQEAGDETAFFAMMSEMRTASVEVADGGEVHVVLGAKPKRPVRVHGRVTEAGSALPEKQVFVFAEGGALLQGMKLTRTDADGRYEIVLDRPGDYVFGVGQKDGMDGTGAPFYVEVPEVDEFEQDLALPLGRIAGVVLGPEGPASGIRIRLVSSAGMIGLDDLSESHRATTEGDGAFAFEHLRPGEYALHVGSDLDGGSQDDRYGQLVVDGLELEPDRAIDGLVVRLEAPGKLEGIVRDPTGAPVGGITIFVRDAAGRAISASDCMSDATGRFTYTGISPGRITASARSPKLVSPESASVEIRSGETSQVELVASQGTFLLVSLLEDDEPVRARLRVVDESGRRVDDLLGMEDFLGVLAEGFSSRERRVGPLAPGKYTLTATTLDGKDAKKSVIVEAGQEERNVKLRLK